jgi:ribosomal protein S2
MHDLRIIIGKKFGKKIKWLFPFSLYIYTLRNNSYKLKINRYWKLFEITLFKINTIIFWGKEE